MKRVFWSGVGYAAGLGTSVYVQRRVRRAVDHYTPEQVRHDVAEKSRQVVGKAKDVVIDLREAASEGADAMRAREQELKNEFGGERDRHQPRPPRIRH
jgi:hypothetical protein